MRKNERPKIVVVGNCCAGKTTLVEGLKAKGYNAVSCPQEHSVSPNFWRRQEPDFLIYLRASLPVIKQRRDIHWGEARLKRQWEVLSLARKHADLAIDTDNLSIAEVLETAVKAIEQWREQNGKNCDS